MDNTRDHKILFSEALKELVELLKQKRLADVFRFVPFAAGESYGPHSHLRIELNYVKKGSCRILLEDESVPFQEGDLMLLPSHVSHKFEAGEKGCTLMQLEFLPDIFWQKWLLRIQKPLLSVWRRLALCIISENCTRLFLSFVGRWWESYLSYKKEPLK